MALSEIAKLGIATGVGAASTLLTDSAIQYWADSRIKKSGEGATAVFEMESDGTTYKMPWYFEYSNWLGAGVSLAAAGLLYKTMGADGKKAALVCALAGVGTALATPMRKYVVEARAEAVTADNPVHGLARLQAMRALAGRPVAVANG